MTNPRENLLRTLRRQGFDTVPLDPNGFCESQREAFVKRFGNDDIWGWFGSPVRGLGVEMSQPFTDWAKYYTHEELPKDVGFDSFGVGHSKQAGCFHMTRMHHPLKGDDITTETLKKYPYPTVIEGNLKKMKAKVAEIQKTNFAAVVWLACSVWETSWYMRSMEDLMMDMLGDDERAVLLLDKITEFSCKRTKEAALAGADIIMLGDDIGMQSTIMMSIELWRTWLKPRLAKVIAEAKNIKPDILIYYHSCGYVLPFLEDLAEIGIDILQPVQPECMKFEDVHKLIGHKMSFWSTIGTQSTLPFGTPQEVKEVVWKNLRTCGAKGGIVIGPTHMVEPEVPWENLAAMKEACEEFKL